MYLITIDPKVLEEQAADPSANGEPVPGHRTEDVGDEHSHYVRRRAWVVQHMSILLTALTDPAWDVRPIQKQFRTLLLEAIITNKVDEFVDACIRDERFVPHRAARYCKQQLGNGGPSHVSVGNAWSLLVELCLELRPYCEPAEGG